MVYKVKEDIQIQGNKMSLVDLNGSQRNFETKFQVSTDSNSRYVVAIVSQDELDNGDFQFESCETDGTFSRKIIRQDDNHINYFIAIKRHPEDTELPPITCHIVKQLRELPANEDSYPLPPLPNQVPPPPTNHSHPVNNPLSLSDSSPLSPLSQPSSSSLPPPLPPKENVEYLFIVGLVCIFLALYFVQKIK